MKTPTKRTRSDEAQASSTAPVESSREDSLPKAPPFDRRKAKSIPPRRHEPTARTVAYEHEGWLYSATGAPVAPAS